MIVQHERLEVVVIKTHHHHGAPEHPELPVDVLRQESVPEVPTHLLLRLYIAILPTKNKDEQALLHKTVEVDDTQDLEDEDEGVQQAGSVKTALVDKVRSHAVLDEESVKADDQEYQETAQVADHRPYRPEALHRRAGFGKLMFHQPCYHVALRACHCGCHVVEKSHRAKGGELLKVVPKDLGYIRPPPELPRLSIDVLQPWCQ
mmetsp:Transcript_63292/g.136077  ORF Transcript_63292/g.136077 Transcript_63292/m.136077 type:complete len:204 (+) Transcript_63292:591-1202(+)